MSSTSTRSCVGRLSQLHSHGSRFSRAFTHGNDGEQTQGAHGTARSGCDGIHISRQFEMLKGNFTDFPDIRHAFFRLLKSIVTHCFSSIFKTPPEYVYVVSSILVLCNTRSASLQRGLDILSSSYITFR